MALKARPDADGVPRCSGCGGRIHCCFNEEMLSAMVEDALRMEREKENMRQKERHIQKLECELACLKTQVKDTEAEFAKASHRMLRKLHPTGTDPSSPAPPHQNSRTRYLARKFSKSYFPQIIATEKRLERAVASLKEQEEELMSSSSSASSSPSPSPSSACRSPTR